MIIPAAPNSIIYIQLYSGLAYIGRLPIVWDSSDDHRTLTLKDALAVLSFPIPMQGPQGQMALNIQTTLIPINPMVKGPKDMPDLDIDMVFQLVECADEHPLVQQYIKATSVIQRVPAAAASTILTAR